MLPEPPQITGDWTTIAPMPDLGELNGPDSKRQHVVDHGLLRLDDGRWRLWACIRGTAVGRLLFGWEGDSLDSGPWRELGVVARGPERDGEERIGAPFFLRHGGEVLCFYHSNGIELMRSSDGLRFDRIGSAGMPGGRDAMVLRHEDEFLGYATITTPDAKRSYVVGSRSKDLRHWTNGTIVCEADPPHNGPVSAESPFVVMRGGWFYLWRASSHDFLTYVYASRDPMRFPESSRIDVLKLKAPEIVHAGGFDWITDLHDFQGIRVSRLTWPR